MKPCLLYTSDAADERSSVDLGGRRIIKKKNTKPTIDRTDTEQIHTNQQIKNKNITKKTKKTTNW